jgi:hypothetical protein
VLRLRSPSARYTVVVCSHLIEYLLIDLLALQQWNKFDRNTTARDILSDINITVSALSCVNTIDCYMSACVYVCMCVCPQEDYVALSDSDDEASEDILQANLAQQRMALIHIEQVCGVVLCSVLSSHSLAHGLCRSAWSSRSLTRSLTKVVFVVMFVNALTDCTNAP